MYKTPKNVVQNSKDFKTNFKKGSNVDITN